MNTLTFVDYNNKARFNEFLTLDPDHVVFWFFMIRPR